MTASPRLGFTYLTSGQAAPETAVNEIGAYLESGSGHFIFKDRDLATPPGSPANGDCYLVAASPTGAWTGKAGYIAYYLGTAWVFIQVIEGYTAWINDENVFVGYDGASWTTLAVASAGSFLQASNNLSDVASAATSRTNLGATTAGASIFTLANPSAITFLRVNADNSVSALSASAFRTAIGAGTGSGGGDLLSTNNLSDVASAATSRTNLGLGTAAVKATGTSGNTVPLLDGTNTWSAAQTDSALATFSAGGNMTPAATPATNAIGYLGAPQNTQNGTYTTVMSDAGKHIYHTSGSAHTWTIDSNANVAYPIGTILTFINENAGGVVTLAITSDTLRWGSSTGSRSLAANGTATAIKVASTTWRLTGDGIT